MSDFIAFPIPQKPYDQLPPSEYPLAALEFTPNQVWNAGFIGHNAYFGHFYEVSATPGDCFWEFWATAEYAATYVIAMGNGGSHPMLAGYDGAGSGKLKLSGNVYDGSGNVSFTSVDGLDPSVWHHVGVGVDHTTNFIYVYLDGILTAKVSFTGTRTVGSLQADLGAMIGGNDHASHKGKVKAVRGFENQIPFASSTFPAAFRPETVFNSTKIVGTTEFASQFCVDFGQKSEVLIDISSGYNGTTHSGKRAIGDEGKQADSDSKLPQWVLANFVTPTFLDTPESIPGGAVIFDDFSRDNQTFAWAGNENSDYPYVGEARTGQNWIGTSGAAPAGQPDVGILEGSAVGLDSDINATNYTWIDSGQTDYTIVIDRVGSAPVNVMLRREDANNYFLASLSSTGTDYFKNVAGGGVTAAGTGPTPTVSTWTRCTLVVSGTNVTTTYTGGGSDTDTVDAALTGSMVGFGVGALGRVSRFLVS